MISYLYSCRFILDRASRVLLKIVAARPDKSAPVAVPNVSGALYIPENACMFGLKRDASG